MVAPATSPAEQAQLLAGQGVAVLPLVPGEKAPATEDGFYSATTDPAKIAAMFAEAGPSAGIGIMPARCVLPGGMLIVLDADSDTAAAALRALFGEPTVTTGGRGAHWYVVVPGDGLPNGLTKTSAKHLDIDIIGAGGGEYVCAPPTHLTGRANGYAWVGDIHTCTEAGEAWLSELAEASLEARKRRTLTESTEAPMRDEWMRETSWFDLLTADGWSDSGIYDACGCPVFTHPWGTDTPRSATAHEEGCGKSQSDIAGGALHVWSTTARKHLGDTVSMSKFGYVIEARHGDASTAREIEGIEDEPGWTERGGQALDVSHLLYEPTVNGSNPFTPLVDQVSAPAAPATAPVALTPQPVTWAPTARTAEEIRDELARIESEDVCITLTEDGKVVGFDGVARDPDDHVRVTKQMQLARLFFPATPELTNVWNAALEAEVNPWGAFAALIPRVLSDIPPQVVMPKKNGMVPLSREAGGSLNTIVYNVGGTSDGKGATEGLASELYPVDTMVLPVGTAQGIYKAYTSTKEKSEDGVPQLIEFWHTDTVIVTVTEVGSLNSELMRDGSSTAAGFCQLYMGEVAGSNTSDRERKSRLPAHMYRFALVIYGQPSLSSVLLTFTSMGLPSRIIWAPGKLDWDYQPIGNGQWQPLTKHKMPWMPQVQAFGGATVTGTTVGPPSAGEPMYCIPWAPAAHAEMAAMRAERKRRSINTSFLEDARAAENNDDSVLSGHEALTTLKVAVAIAVIHGRHAVTDLDWQLACCVRLMMRYMRQSLVQIVSTVGDSQSTGKARQTGRNRVIADDAAAEVREERVRAAADTIMRRIGDRESWSASEMSKGMFKGSAPERRPEYRDAALTMLVDGEHLIQDGKRYRKATP
ncbi:bifunctional DNA primase/polymerase [Mycobacteroides immunogenum]|uniref:bifunctional DNA primase/polymerase n=1 Tax=Mycobacteroides immunogenum TaxID=83262 RepID=UPI0025B764BB|nr:bifunctional DNA primase/polymerase [Mycobacteroides immunogenum]WJR35270.1 bifunctional DNA primase/polymerase [Mycobacteroides immunogenum]